MLGDKKIAILATDGFEESELMKPKKALQNAGADVDVIALKAGDIKSWSHGDWGSRTLVEKIVGEARPENYDGLLLPGGVINADALRQNREAIEFVTEFIKAGKPIAAICHGAWILIETGLVKGRTMTSYSAIKTDLVNAGVKWVDQEVVVDENWVTSRKPDDIPAFNTKMLEIFGESRSIPGRRSAFLDNKSTHRFEQ